MENKTPIIYNDEDHSYWNGPIRIPGISELLKYWGYIDSTYYNEEARDRGTLIHNLIADFLNGGQEYMGHTDKEITERIHAFNAFVIAKGFKPTQIEAIQFSETSNIACRIDLIGTFNEAPIPCIIEVKCGARAAWHNLQSACQALCSGIFPIRRFALYLKADGKFDLREHNKRVEIQVVQALAAAYWYNKQEGIKLIQGGI